MHQGRGGMAGRVDAHLLEQVGKEVPVEPFRHIFAEGHEVLLVIMARGAARGIEEQGPVEDLHVARRVMLEAGDAGQQGAPGLAGQVAHQRGQDAVIVEIEGQGRLGPDDEGRFAGVARQFRPRQAQIGLHRAALVDGHPLLVLVDVALGEEDGHAVPAPGIALQRRGVQAPGAVAQQQDRQQQTGARTGGPAPVPQAEDHRDPQAGQQVGARYVGRLYPQGPGRQGTAQGQPGEARHQRVGVFQKIPGKAQQPGLRQRTASAQGVGQQAEQAAGTGQAGGHQHGADRRQGQGQVAHGGHGDGQPVEHGRHARDGGQPAAAQGRARRGRRRAQQGQAQGQQQGQRRQGDPAVGERQPQRRSPRKAGAQGGRTQPGVTHLRLPFQGPRACFPGPVPCAGGG